MTVHDYPDGTISIRHDGAALPCSAFDKVDDVKQADTVDNKRLDVVLAFSKARQELFGAQRSKKAPGRRGQKLIQAEGTRRDSKAIR